LGTSPSVEAINVVIKNGSNSNGQPASAAFTLPELLIVSVIGGILLVSAAQLILAHVRTTTRIEGKLRAQDVWTRVQFLLEQEIQESACSTASGSTLILTLPPCGEATSPTITYNLQGTNLIRTGPTIDSANGALILDGSSSTDTVASNVSSFAPSSADGRNVAYQLNILDPSGFSFSSAGKSSSAQTRSRIIDSTPAP
jgi:prepilin-type N-terminal cleavage/methylation domain-containing protein